MRNTGRYRRPNSLLAPISRSGLEIREISAEETYPVRRPVLRPGRPAKECIFNGDEGPDTIHLGAFITDRVVAVASYMHQKNPLFEAPVQYQLRGMAVLEDFQKQGLGQQLLKTGEKILKDRFINPLLWFNARETAIEFYKKFGYQTRGQIFMIPNVCPHIVMFRQLNPQK
ncbi:MAG: GNAT family N-acetyltransferase [Salinimicrobium sp.]